MMLSVGIYLRRWQRALQRLVRNSRFHGVLQAGAYVLCGLLLSAGSLARTPMPLALGLLFAVSGWPAVLLAMGGAAGYMIFWGSAGTQGVVWIAAGLICVLLLADRPLRQDTPLLMPALSALLIALTGLAFQLWMGDDTPVAIFLLRIAMAAFSTWIFGAAMVRRDPVLDWLVCGLSTLALAQVMPIPYLDFGCIAAGALAVAGAFPAAALAGLALDLARITPTPMTAVLCLSYLLRLIPGKRRWFHCAAPAAVYLLVMALCGTRDLLPLPGLLLGGFAAMLLPGQPGKLSHRRGETGAAQVRLEMASSVLRQTRTLLEEVEDLPIDEEAILSRAVDRACGSCPCRKTCKDTPRDLPTGLLHRPLGNGADLPLRCRKSGRMLQELRRGQEQLRAIRADRDRQAEYRAAILQQYRFLSDYLQELSDTLARRSSPPQPWYEPEIAVCSASQEKINGDRCMWFAGTECRYYILLCDGMGTGAEAARDAERMGGMLRKLLSAGYPAEYALRSVNSLCALQGRAGAVTIDLAELRLDSGRVNLYKWGAAPSYVLCRGEPIKIGTAAPPPGLSVTDGREAVERLSLKRGETLVLLSDGAGGEEALRRAWDAAALSCPELAERILDDCCEDGCDDATVAVVRLSTVPVSV